MAKTDLTRDTLPSLLNRLDSLTPDSERRWGTMSVEQMLRHLRLGFQASLEEIPIEDNSNLLFKLMKPLLLSGLVPTPKGRAPAPNEYRVDSADSFEKEMAQLRGAIERFVDSSEQEPDRSRLHPIFSMMTVPEWQRGHALHCDHHLKQFGV